jgi:hypothetical protein
MAVAVAGRGHGMAEANGQDRGHGMAEANGQGARPRLNSPWNQFSNIVSFVCFSIFLLLIGTSWSVQWNA